jgi:hypothetical protein
MAVDTPVITIEDTEGHGRLMRLIANTLQREGYKITLKKGEIVQHLAMPTRGIQKEIIVEIK